MLEKETLTALIEEFVTREGAVQGHSETSLAARVREVMGQLKEGTVVIVVGEGEEGGCSIVPAEALPFGET